MTPIELGRTYKDVVTGFQGIAIGRVEYVSGCNQVLVQPVVINGEWKDSHWFDEERLILNRDIARIPDLLGIGRSPAKGYDKEAPRR